MKYFICTITAFCLLFSGCGPRMSDAQAVMAAQAREDVKAAEDPACPGEVKMILIRAAIDRFMAATADMPDLPPPTTQANDLMTVAAADEEARKAGVDRANPPEGTSWLRLISVVGTLIAGGYLALKGGQKLKPGKYLSLIPMVGPFLGFLADTLFDTLATNAQHEAEIAKSGPVMRVFNATTDTGTKV